MPATPSMIYNGTILKTPTALPGSTSYVTISAAGVLSHTTTAVPATHASTHAAAGSDPLTLSQSQITNLTTDLSNKADLVSGVVPTNQIPSIAVTEYLGTAANQSAMLLLSGQKGDWCVRSDLSTTWVITGSDPTQLSSWTELSYPTAPVTSVNSQTGAVTLSYSDVGAAQASHTQAFSTITSLPSTLSGYGITDAQPLDADLTALAALSGTDNIYYRSGANTWSTVTMGSGLSFSGGTLTVNATLPGLFEAMKVWC